MFDLGKYSNLCQIQETHQNSKHSWEIKKHKKEKHETSWKVGILCKDET